MKRHRFLVYFETYLTPIMQFFRNISSTLQTWQNDRIWRLFVFGFHQKSFTTICELSWMPTTQSILSSRLRSVPPCRLRPPVLSDHICLAHWVVVIYRFYCTCVFCKYFPSIHTWQHSHTSLCLASLWAAINGPTMGSLWQMCQGLSSWSSFSRVQCIDGRQSHQDGNRIQQVCNIRAMIFTHKAFDVCEYKKYYSH